MMQVAKRLEGKLRACTCERQPFHVHAPGPGEHWLECPPCLVRTPRFGSLQEAVQAWDSVTVVAVAPAADGNVLTFRRKQAVAA